MSDTHRLHSCLEASRCARPEDRRCFAPNPEYPDGGCALGDAGVWPPGCCDLIGDHEAHLSYRLEPEATAEGLRGDDLPF